MQASRVGDDRRRMGEQASEVGRLPGCCAERCAYASLEAREGAMTYLRYRAGEQMDFSFCRVMPAFQHHRARKRTQTRNE